MAQLQIRNGQKDYGNVKVLRDINLEIEDGEFVVLVGPSGCGKSTLLRMISGLEEITSGEMELDGDIINDVDPAKRGTAMVFQSYALFPHMTVAENMGFSLKLAKRPKSEIEAKISDAARILQLEKLLDRKPSQLSGGQKQRVAIGRAIVRNPKIFLFDEPLSNLDAELRIQMRAELLQLHRQLGSTMIYVTHDQVEAMTLADKMVVLEAGNVQQVGRPLELYDDPENKFVAGFVGTPKMNFIDAIVKENNGNGLKISLADIGNETEISVPWSGEVPNAGEGVVIGIRPENLKFSDKESKGLSILVSVAFVEELGDLTYVFADSENGKRLTLEKKDGRHDGSSRGYATTNIDTLLLFSEKGKRLRPS